MISINSSNSHASHVLYEIQKKQLIYKLTCPSSIFVLRMPTMDMPQLMGHEIVTFCVHESAYPDMPWHSKISQSDIYLPLLTSEILNHLIAGKHKHNRIYHVFFLDNINMARFLLR